MIDTVRTPQGRPPRAHPAVRPPRRARPRLEALDPRDVPAVVHVTTGADSGPGSLRDALALCTAGGLYGGEHDEIIIDASVPEVRLQSSLAVVNSFGVVIRSANPANPAEIIPNLPGQWHTFRFLLAGTGNSGTYELRDLNVFHFGASDWGGGVLHYGQELIIDHCGFADNQAGANGGAIANFGFKLTVSNSLFGRGGPLTELNPPPGTPGNTAGDSGGAIFHAPNGGTQPLTITGSYIMYNTAQQGGGGVYSATLDTTSITQTVVRYNAALNGYGGGVYHAGGTLYMVATGPTFDGAPWVTQNSAHYGGSGIYSGMPASLTVDLTVGYNMYPPAGIPEPNLLIEAPAGPMYIGPGVASYTII